MTPSKVHSNTHSLPRSIAFNLFFFSSIIFLHITQLLVFPFVVLFNLTLFDRFRLHYNCLARKTFAIILVLVTQIFAPTKLVLTSDDSIDLDKVVRRDRNQNVISIDLPSHSIMMANHQIYADWLYIWSLAYLADLHSALIIILKASLKWVPIVGPAMQMFSFIFLNRSWASDKEDLTSQLNKLADQTYNPSIEALNKIGLLIFPEGTLVSPLTRPMSKKYAEKCGIDDLQHCLLPRSTGSLFCMRALSRKIPNLKLIDLTIGYPGIPAEGYGQDYYTLQSIFGQGRPPPTVHIHIKVIPISAIPIGRIDAHTSTASSASSQSSRSSAGLSDPTTEEVEQFDGWLRDLWRRKDDDLAGFYRHGHFNHAHHPDRPPTFESIIQLRNLRDAARTLVLAIPGLALLLWSFNYIRALCR